MTDKKMLDFVDFIPDHLERIKIRSAQDGERPKSIRGPAVTILSDGEPLAIFGWYFICPGVVQIWAFVSEGVSEHKKSFHKACKAFLANGIGPVGARRIQFSVRCGFQQGWRWAKALGFRCEGVMEQYAPDGQPCWLFARTFP